MDDLFKDYLRFGENKIKNRRTRLFTLIKRPDACFFYRIQIPQQQLARQFGWECKYKTIDPLPADLKRGVPNTIVEGDSAKSFQNLVRCHKDDIEWADIIEMQRPTCEHHLDLMHYIQKEIKKPVVISCDDNYLDVPTWNAGYEYFEPRSQYIKEMIADADLLSVTTEYLADIYRPLRCGRPIAICPNSINFEEMDAMPETMQKYEIQDKRKYFIATKRLHLQDELCEKYSEWITKSLNINLATQGIKYSEQILESYKAANREVRFQIPDDIYSKNLDGKIVIGWTGSPTHLRDLQVIENGIIDVLNSNDNFNLVLCGMSLPSWFSKISREKLWEINLVPVRYYYSMLKQMGMTISLAPVNRDTFNLGKSNIKSIEACAVGQYSIVSDYATYDGVPSGVPKCLTDEDWKKAIYDATNDEAMRFEVCQNNREFVEKNFNIAENVKYWKDSYEDLL